jgi:hypothetical protein
MLVKALSKLGMGPGVRRDDEFKGTGMNDAGVCTTG